METLRIDILDPKVKKLLKELAALKLIKIQKDSVDFDPAKWLAEMRSKADKAPTPGEIQAEVKVVRFS